MNILVLCDNNRLFPDVVGIFKRFQTCVTNSTDINPQLDYNHIIKHFGLVFSIHCKKIFPKVLTDRIRCINVHPGYNPYNKGMYPHIFSIINGLPAGVTIHEMTERIDDGPVIFQEEVKVLPYDTGETLYERIIECEKQLLASTVDRLISHQYEALPKFGGNYNSKKDFEKLCEIDLTGTAEQLYNQLRALSFPGYNNARINNHFLNLKIYENDHPENH